jgi:hypothetical protein
VDLLTQTRTAVDRMLQPGADWPQISMGYFFKGPQKKKMLTKKKVTEKEM